MYLITQILSWFGSNSEKLAAIFDGISYYLLSRYSNCPGSRIARPGAAGLFGLTEERRYEDGRRISEFSIKLLHFACLRTYIKSQFINRI